MLHNPYMFDRNATTVRYSMVMRYVYILTIFQGNDGKFIATKGVEMKTLKVLYNLGITCYTFHEVIS